jgi:hypothetical protein
MKKVICSLVFLCLTLNVHQARADDPVFTFLLWDTTPAVAYNSTSGQYLVVWNMFNVFYPPTDPLFFGPVMGQLKQEDGTNFGDPFMIFDAGVLPDVAYNVEENEFLVVSEQWFNTVGQRISAQGTKVGAATTLMTKSRWPKVLYNSMSGDYLVCGAMLTDSAPDLCDIWLKTKMVNKSGQAVGGENVIVSGEGHGLCADGARYALAYAPLTMDPDEPPRPNNSLADGRYLLAVGSPTNLTMLDSQGKPMPTLLQQNGSWWPSIPFQQSKVGKPFSVDVTYGKWQGEDVFFLVWSDRDQYVKFDPDTDSCGGDWTGVWGGIVNANSSYYKSTWAVSNEVFPISLQWNHAAGLKEWKQWRPVVAYNGTDDSFVVAWRETPFSEKKPGIPAVVPDPRDLSPYHHIRANKVKDHIVPPGSCPEKNLLMSANIKEANPTFPAICASGNTTGNLIVWEDHRNFFGIGDIYGSLLD